MNPVTREQRDEAIAHFKYEGTLVKDCPYGSGHINDTFLLVFEKNQSHSSENEFYGISKTGRSHGEYHRSDIISEKEDYRKWWRSGT